MSIAVLSSTKVYNVYDGTASVTGLIPPYTETGYTFGPVTIDPDTTVSSATLYYSIKPDYFPTAAGFVVKVNGVKVAEESWDVFTGANLRSKTVSVNLQYGDNYVELFWNIVFIIPGQTTNFSTRVVLTIEYSGKTPSIPTEKYVEYVMYGFIILGAILGVSVIYKIIRSKKG